MLKLLKLHTKTEIKIVDLVSHLFFFLLALLAIFYREERLISDAGYYFFRVVNNESFWVEHDRYILILSQISPWLGSNIGLGLGAIVLISSLGHILFYYGIYLITRYVYKELYSGLFLLSIQLLGITSGFFVPMFEFYYAMGLLVLFYIIFKNSQHKYRHIILMILAFFIITAHFYAIILLVYVFWIYALENKDFRVKKYLPYALLVLLFIVVKPFFISDYEKGKSADFLINLEHNVYDFEYLKLWLKYIVTNYWDWALLVLLTGGLMLFKKKYLLFFSYTFFLIILIMMVNVSSYGFDLSRYKEQVNFSLMFLAGFTFVYSFRLLCGNTTKYILLALISVIFIFRLQSIWNEGKQFSERLVEMKSIIDRTQEEEGTKFVINQDELEYDANWSYPLETLIYSSIYNDKCVTIAIDDDYYFEENNEKLKSSEYMFRRWEIYDLSRLNSKFFELDNSEYSRMKIGEE